MDSDSVTRTRREYAFMVHSGQCTTKSKILSTRICKKKVRRLYIPGMFTLMPRESNFSLLGNINPFLYNELVEKMLMFSAFHKKEKPINIHFNVALDRMLLRSQASLL